MKRALRLICGGMVAASTWLAAQAPAPPPLELDHPARPGSPLPGSTLLRLTTPTQPGRVLRLEAADNLAAWREIGVAHDALLAYPDPDVTWPDPAFGRRFYRVQSRARVADDDGKNQLVFPDDAFATPFVWDNVRWVKFAILKSDPRRVYYQDTKKYPFHHDFATRRLAPFIGMDRAAFDAVSLRRAGQQVVLGSVLLPPRPNFIEYGVQFVGLDPYTPEEVAEWFAAVKNTIHAENGAGACYMPVFEQAESVRRQAAEYEARGITVATLDRWLTLNHVYSPGWALGGLKYFPATEIDAAFRDGRLRPQDVLLTDGVPAETPLVAGLISLTPSTPNSHTAILARSFGIPFVHLPDAEERARVQALVGRKIVLRATEQFGGTTVKVIDVEGALDAELEAELLALKIPAPLDYTPKASFGNISTPVAGLTPADIRYVGGKAANFGFLRRATPDHSPAEALAFTFDLWDAFLAQPLPGPGAPTLREEIAARLAPHTTWPPQIDALKTTLAGLRDLLRQTAAFTPAQQQAILDTLAGFTPTRKIRFRSSTNVEDSATFTGAGLYDSYSGCLLDDLDADTTGPCHCDPAEANERGVFRALQRVYASFYNDNAYLERLRLGVKENEVGMGVLVHYSFPDEEELANGVATLNYRRFLNTTSLEGRMVSQVGAESVTNPDGAALPETVTFFTYGPSADLELRQTSSRLPLGAFVLNWRKDYDDFLALFAAVGDAYQAYDPTRSSFDLDFEYKKDVNLGLVLKQVRELPTETAGTPVTAVILNEPTEWVVSQREAGTVFGNHRMKSVWNFHLAAKKLTPANLAQGLYTQGTLDYVDQDRIATLDGPLSAWPDARPSADGKTHAWTIGTGSSRATWAFLTDLSPTVIPPQPPVVTPNDFSLTVTATYTTPQPEIDYNGDFITTTTDYIVLEPRRPLLPGSTLVHREMSNDKGVTVSTRFYWPNEPPLSAGYTAPLVHFVETVITGVTREPLVVRGYYAQTYRPGHHNFSEEFIFEPRLDPGVSPALLEELATANIRCFHVTWGHATTPITVLGLDGTLRKL